MRRLVIFNLSILVLGLVAIFCLGRGVDKPAEAIRLVPRPTPAGPAKDISTPIDKLPAQAPTGCKHVGVQITRFEHSGPEFRAAGLFAGDIIVEVNGKVITFDYYGSNAFELQEKWPSTCNLKVFRKNGFVDLEKVPHMIGVVVTGYPVAYMPPAE